MTKKNIFIFTLIICITVILAFPALVKRIGYENNKLVYYEQNEVNTIDENVPVSVNLFGFTPKIMDSAKYYFKQFFLENPDKEKGEFYLPTIVQKSIDDGLADVKILHTTSKFNGMTYREDLEQLKNNILQLINDGVYPKDLWGNWNEK